MGRARDDRLVLRRVRRVLAGTACLLALVVSGLYFFGDRLLSEGLVIDGERRRTQADWHEGMRFAWEDRGRVSRDAIPVDVLDELTDATEAQDTSGAPEGGSRLVIPDERGACLDPRGGDLVFARRDEGSGWNLYRARWTPRGWREPEALFELNSGSDDVDPRFSADGASLWFASRRSGGAGGYDLWRAWREGEGFSAPENLGPVINGPQDERHPAPGPDRLVLASNRLAEDGTRFELFEAELARDESGQSLADWDRPELIAELSVEGLVETRSPALSADGRFLYFASDRPGGRGGYDLWRSLRFDGRWREPRPLEALNSAEDEFDPGLSREGFQLVYARRRADDPSGLACGLRLAERREMLRLRDPGAAPWRQWLSVLAVILVVLLLTLLALKWQSLHPFVKFLILSIILHLLFLIFAEPPEEAGLGRGDGGERAFAVTFLASDESSNAPSARAASGDRVAVERQVTASAAASAAAAARSAASAPDPASEAPSAAAPSRTAEVPTETADSLAAAAPAARQATASNASPANAAAAASRAVAKRAGAALEVGETATRARGVAPSSAEPLANNGVKVAPRSDARPVGTDAPEGPRETAAPARAVARGMGESASEVSVPAAGRSRSAAETAGAAPRPALARTGVATGQRAGQDPSVGETAGRASEVGETNASARGAAAASGPGERASAATGSSPSIAAPASGPTGRSTASARDAVGEGSAELARATPVGRRGRARARGLAAGPRARNAARGKRDADDAQPGAAANGVGEAVALATDQRRGDSRTVAMRGGPRADETAPESGFGPRDLVARRADAGAGETPASTSESSFRGRRRRPRLGGSSRSRAGRRRDRGDAVAEGDGRANGKGRTESTTADGGEARALTVAPRRGGAPAGRPGEDRRARGRGAEIAALVPRDLLRRRDARLAEQEEPTAAADVYGRRQGQARLEALEAAGGTAETEAAVLSGLRYLKSKQKRNGHWGTGRRDDKYGDLRAGKTGLALLAFLGSGYTQEREGEFQETVRAGIDYLLQVQDERSGHIGGGSSYGHGIATYALAEAYAMTRDETLKRPLWRATQRILSAQIRSRRDRMDGAWSYYYSNPERRFDGWSRMSVTVWQIMALESARIGGIRVPDEALTRARAHVSRAWDDDREAFRYNHDPEWLGNRYPILPGSSAAAVFALQLLGGEQNAADRRHIRQGLDFCLERRPRFRWRKPSQDDFVRRGHGNEYFMYYATLALRMQGGADWRAWNDRLKPILLDNQSEDGSWRPISYYAEYAQDSNRDRSYTTAMCVLMLEAYYRYDTPLLKKLARELKAEAVAPASEVVVDDLDAGSAAARARLRVGDVILELDGVPTPTIEALEKVNDGIADDARPRIKIRRGDRELILRGRGPLGGLTVREEDT